MNTIRRYIILYAVYIAFLAAACVAFGGPPCPPPLPVMEPLTVWRVDAFEVNTVTDKDGNSEKRVLLLWDHDGNGIVLRGWYTNHPREPFAEGGKMVMWSVMCHEFVRYEADECWYTTTKFSVVDECERFGGRKNERPILWGYGPDLIQEEE